MLPKRVGVPSDIVALVSFDVNAVDELLEENCRTALAHLMPDRELSDDDRRRIMAKAEKIGIEQTRRQVGEPSWRAYREWTSKQNRKQPSPTRAADYVPGTSPTRSPRQGAKRAKWDDEAAREKTTRSWYEATGGVPG